MPNTSKQNQPYFIDIVTMEVLYLQTVPLELDIDPSTTWATINAPGRNNGLYQYTGAEDTLSFTISWYADEANKQDVIKKCKWLEARAKNDGYDQKPHRLKFIFGELFVKAEWILFSVKYKISLFDRSKDMMPCLATQDIVLKRVMDTNRSRIQILKIDS